MKRRTCGENQARLHIAMEYARTELGFADPRPYGSQIDPSVPGVGAVWVKDMSDGNVVGLVISVEDGVLEEFDPDHDGEPGQLGEKSEPDLTDMLMRVL